MSNERIVNIENWSVQESDNSPFKAPELRSNALYGNIYGHPEFEDGKYVHTSRIIEIDLEKGKVVTRNTIYQLGKIDEKYLKYCEENNVKDLELLKKYKGE